MTTVRRLPQVLSRELWWWLRGAARLFRRYPIRSVAWLAALIWWWWWHEQLVIVAAMVLPVLAVALWARVGPVSYRRRLADPFWRWRTKRSLKKQWPLIMESVGLARRVPAVVRPVRIQGQPPVLPADRVSIPGRGRVRWIDGQLVALPHLLTGQTVEDVEAVVDRLRVAVGARRCRIDANSSMTACSIVWGFTDPLATAFDATVPALGAAVPALGRLRLGRTEDGIAWRLPFGLSTLVAGSSGSGKASLIWGLMFALAPAIKAGLVQVHGIDLKGGMELSMGRNLFTRYAQTAEHAVTLLEDAAAELQARAARLAGHTRRHTPTVDEPLVVVLVDELAALIAYLPDRDLTRRAEAALSVILSQGRAVGHLMFAFLQDPRKETVRMRHLFTQSLGLRLRDREEVAMVLGDGAVHAGALCHKISRDTPGVGYVLGDDNRPMRVRAGYVSDDMIRTCAQRFRAPHHVPIVVPVVEPVQRPPSSSRPRSSRARASSKGAAA